MSLFYEGKYHVSPPTGDYVVGFTDIMTGSGLEGCFVRLFYPSDIQDDVFEHHEKWAHWIPHPKYIEGYASVPGLFLPIFKYLCSWIFGRTYVPIVRDAAPAKRKFPVVVFSHGLSACRMAYSVFCSDVASHGFVVAAIEHRDASACLSYTLLEDGTERWIPYINIKLETTDFDLRQVQLDQRVQDCQRTLEFLRELDSGEVKSQIALSSMDLQRFQGLMDLTNVGLAGHSFGGATLLRTLAVEKRFKYGLAMDAWMWPLKELDDLHERVDQPLFFINMESFQTKLSLKCMNRFLVKANGAERRAVTLRGSVHRNQSDVSVIVPRYLRRLVETNSRIDPFLAMSLNNKLSLLFLWERHKLEPKTDYVDLIQKHQDVIIDGIYPVDP